MPASVIYDDSPNGNGLVRMPPVPPNKGILGPDGLPWHDPDNKRTRGPDTGFAVSPVIMFSSVMGSGWRTYWHDRWDEAMRHGREQAIAMTRDAFLMGLMQERKLAASSLKWHIEVDDKRDPRQKAIADGMTTVVKATPRFRQLCYYLHEAVWYGRYGAALKWDWQRKKVPGLAGGLQPGSAAPSEWRRCMTLTGHKPINGDKIGHHWDGTPYLLVHSTYAYDLENADVGTTTVGGRALFLRGSWRQHYVVHSHQVLDADFFDAEQAEKMHGVGVRDVVYWINWIRQEGLSNILDWCERTGLGIRLWYYQGGNTASFNAVRKAAKDQSDKVNILVPRFGENPVEGVDYVDTTSTGADLLLKLQQHYEEVIERYIVGQSMSGGSQKDKGSGLGGSGWADVAADTKRRITEYDAWNLGETLTEDVVKPASVWTYPEVPYEEHNARLVFDVDQRDPEAILNAAKTFTEMGGTVPEDEVRGPLGFSAPREGDKVLGGQPPLPPGTPGLPGAPPKPGEPAKPNGAPPPEQLSRYAREKTPIAAGLAVLATDTGRVLMIQRGVKEDDPASGKWEFPGGHIDEGESPLEGAEREWEEEVGLDLPKGKESGEWKATNGKYVGFIRRVKSEDAVPLTDGRDHDANPDGDYFEAVAWVDPKDFGNHNLRKELLEDAKMVAMALKRSHRREGKPQRFQRPMPPLPPEFMDELDRQALAYGPMRGNFIAAVMQELQHTDSPWEALQRGRVAFHSGARYAKDASGHEHRGKGEGGGQFASGGGTAEHEEESVEPINDEQRKVIEHADKLSPSIIGRARALLDKAPGGQWMREKTKRLYDQFEKRYGKGQALAIFAAGQAVGWGATAAGTALTGVPVWIPGSTVVGMLPFAAIAEVYYRMRKGKTKHSRRYTKDASGHEHKGAGPGGGQFTSMPGSEAEAMTPHTNAASNPIDAAMTQILTKDSVPLLNADGVDPDWIGGELKAMGHTATPQDIAAAGKRIAAAARSSPKPAPAPKALKPAPKSPPAPVAAAPAAAVAPAPQPIAPAAPAPAMPKATGNALADKILGLEGKSVGYIHGGATGTAANVLAPLLEGEKFAGRIDHNTVASVLHEYGMVGEKVGAGGRLEFQVRNPAAVTAILNAARTGMHDGLPVMNSMQLRRVAGLFSKEAR